MPNLRVKSDKEQRALAVIWAATGSWVKDVFFYEDKSGHAPSDRSRLQASGAAPLSLMTLAPTEGFQKACFQDFELCSTRRLKPRMSQRKKL